MKILLSKVQFNASFISLGPRKIALHSQNLFLGFWKLAAHIHFISQMLLWQDKTTFYIKLQVKSGLQPCKRSPEHKFLFSSHIWFYNLFIRFLIQNVLGSKPKKSFLQGRSKLFMSVRCKFGFLQVGYRQGGSLGECPHYSLSFIKHLCTASTLNNRFK